jgi:hypothetical protein
MNPLDTKLRRNRFSGYSARHSTNALARSSWGKKNPNGIPVPKLGLVWNSLINGLNLIESIADELLSVGDVFELVETSLEELPSEVGALLEMYSESINGRFREWSAGRTPEDARRMSSILGDGPIRHWLSTTTFDESSSEMREWFLLDGGGAFEESLNRILKEHDKQ